MLSLNTPIHSHFHPKLISHFNIPSVLLVSNTGNRAQVRTKKVAGFDCFLGKTRSNFFGFLEVGRGNLWKNSWCCCCKERLESEADSTLEEEILAFMDQSGKPGSFPSKKELVEAGRLDLVEAIKNRGGWFILGWDSEDERENNEDEASKIDFDITEFQKRVESCEDCGSLKENEAGSLPSSSEDSSVSSNHSATSSGTLEVEVEEDCGIDGILSRLEKERSSAFGITLGMPEFQTHAPGDYQHFETSIDVDRIDPGKNSRYTSGSPSEGTSSSADGGHRHYTEPDTWRSWSLNGAGSNNTELEDRIDPEKNSRHPSGSVNEGRPSSSDGSHRHYTETDTWRSWSLNRAGFDNTEFEAAEISYSKNQIEDTGEASIDETAKTADATKALDKLKETNNYDIQTRLQNLEMELASALNSLRSEKKELNPKKVLETSSEEFQTLSDALEFQENECISSQERLRSIRIKLAVVEGKMALAIRDAEKILEEKQRRIDSACKAMQLLRTVYIVWPGSASEVLLAGSFDGWTTQRKMGKSQTGFFSVFLKLYPGRYEIKFIVDGNWRIDPLRPIVNSNGYENNLLVVT